MCPPLAHLYDQHKVGAAAGVQHKVGAGATDCLAGCAGRSYSSVWLLGNGGTLKPSDALLGGLLVRKNVDKLSFSFLQSRSGPHFSIAPVYFSEQLLALLAIPSVLCRGKVGLRD